MLQGFVEKNLQHLVDLLRQRRFFQDASPRVDEYINSSEQLQVGWGSQPNISDCGWSQPTNQTVNPNQPWNHPTTWSPSAALTASKRHTRRLSGASVFEPGDFAACCLDHGLNRTSTGDHNFFYPREYIYMNKYRKNMKKLGKQYGGLWSWDWVHIENVTNTSLWPQLSPALRVVQPSCASPKRGVAPDSAKPPRMAENFGTLMGFNWIYIMGLLYLKRIAQQLI